MSDAYYHVEPFIADRVDLGGGYIAVKAWKVVEDGGVLSVASLTFWHEGAAEDFAALMSTARARRCRVPAWWSWLWTKRVLLYGAFLLAACSTPPHPNPVLAPSVLTWTDNSGGVAVTLIERRLFDGLEFAPIVDVAAGVTEYVDTTAAASGQYCYRVRAAIGNTLSDYSNEACTPEGGSR